MKVVNFFKRAWQTLPEAAKHVVHTFWQTFLSVFLLGVLGILSRLAATHSFTDAKSATIALVAAALAAAFSAVKNTKS